MCKNVTDGRSTSCIQKAGENHLHKLQVNNSVHNKGTSYLFSKWVNWCQGDGFSSVGT